MSEHENYLADGIENRPTARPIIKEPDAETAYDDDLAKRRAEFAAMQARHRAMMDQMIATTRSMFGKTPPEVSVNALALAVEEAHQLGELRKLEGLPAPNTPDIRQFSAKIHGKEVGYYLEGKDEPSFLDDGKNIYVQHVGHDAALLASLQLAQLRWGAIKVNGTDAFKDRVVQLAVEHDLKLANADLAKRVLLRREAEGVLAAPSAEELEAVSQLQSKAAKEVAAPVVTPEASDAKASVAAKAPENVAPAAPEEAPEATPAQASVETAPMETVAPESEPEPETVVEADKAWIEKLKAEHRSRREAEAAMKAQETEVVAAEPAAAAGQDIPDFDDEVIPEVEIDLGLDDDDFDPFSPATPASAIGAQKVVNAGARP